MIIIGEKLNSSIPKTYAAMAARDQTAIMELITAQTRAGAAYLDINTAMFLADELKMLEWVISLTAADSSVGIMIDSLNYEAVKKGLECCKGRSVIINSVTNEDKYLPTIRLAAEYGCGLVLMPQAKNTAKAIAADAKLLMERAKENGVKAENIYIDALVQTVSADDKAGVKLLDTVRLLKAECPDCHITCGLSNISFGMPGRARLNATLLSMAAACGLDSVIADPTNDILRETVAAIDLLQGKDFYGMRFLSCMRGEMPGDFDLDEDE